MSVVRSEWLVLMTSEASGYVSMHWKGVYLVGYMARNCEVGGNGDGDDDSDVVVDRSLDERLPRSSWWNGE